MCSTREDVGHGEFLKSVRVSAARSHQTITEPVAPLDQGYRWPGGRVGVHQSRAGQAAHAEPAHRWPSARRFAHDAGGPSGRGRGRGPGNRTGCRPAVVVRAPSVADRRPDAQLPATVRRFSGKRHLPANRTAALPAAFFRGIPTPHVVINVYRSAVSVRRL